MKDQLEKIKQEALRQIDASDALEKLNDIRVAYLGKKGELTSVLKSMKDVAPEDRPKVGQMVNDARAIIEARLEETKNVLARKAREEQLKKEVIDVTLPAKKNHVGHSHPNTIALEEVERIWYEGESRREKHYDKSRYHCLNLHSVLQKGTVEFRLLNGAVHGRRHWFRLWCVEKGVELLWTRMKF